MYEKFYPVNVLETGWDIIPFWVIRMLMLGYEYTKQTPFKTIYIHGLVRDEHGSKMSKSKGNGIDPIEIIKDYGTDTLRMSLSIGTTPGNDLNFNMKNVENNALVLNKFWNVIRFVHANIGTIDSTPELLTKKILKNKTALLPHEQWIMSRLDALIEQMTESIDAFQFGEAGQQFFSFLRDEFADFFVEEYKLTKDTSKNGRDVLAYATLTILRLAHPFVPFITEELWGRIQSDKGLLMNAAWPTELDVRDTKLEKDTAVLFELIRSLRSFRTEQGVKPGELIEAHIHTTKRSLPIIESNLDILKGLTKLSSVVFHKTKIQNSGYSYLVVRDIDVYIPRTEVDNKSEIERINKDIADKQAYLRIINAKLTNKNFVKNAPEQIIRVEQDKKSAAEEQLARLEEKLKSLS
jgi:valyl-tRNA synthetase